MGEDTKGSHCLILSILHYFMYRICSAHRNTWEIVSILFILNFTSEEKDIFVMQVWKRNPFTN